MSSRGVTALFESLVCPDGMSAPRRPDRFGQQGRRRLFLSTVAAGKSGVQGAEAGGWRGNFSVARKGAFIGNSEGVSTYTAPDMLDGSIVKYRLLDDSE